MTARRRTSATSHELWRQSQWRAPAYAQPATAEEEEEEAHRASPSDGEKTELTISPTSRTPQHKSSKGTFTCKPLASRCSIHLALAARASSSTSADAFSTPCISCELTYAMKAACRK